jgi:hypothetical protein
MPSSICHLSRRDWGATGISVGFELAPPPKKPKAKVPVEDFAAYKVAKKIHGLPARGVEMLKALRQECDAEGLTQDILAVGDGGYTNRTLIQGLPARMEFIGRVRKDIKLFAPAPGKGRKVYGERLPTPEAFRTDATLLERATTCFYGGKDRDIRYKELSRILWQPKSTRSPQMGPSILGKLSPPPNAVGKRPRGWCRIAG